ncbi:type II toxin-antitoxin system HicB family antitoxin [Chloroflexota bacterium]
MLTEYVERAMSRAMYEKLEDGTYCGKIPECSGTIAFDETLYQCQSRLKSVLEGWLLVKIRHGDEREMYDAAATNVQTEQREN